MDEENSVRFVNMRTYFGAYDSRSARRAVSRVKGRGNATGYFFKGSVATGRGTRIGDGTGAGETLPCTIPSA